MKSMILQRTQRTTRKVTYINTWAWSIYGLTVK